MPRHRVGIFCTHGHLGYTHRFQIILTGRSRWPLFSCGQAATSPDFSHLDASIFPTLEKECNKTGASTASEIEAAVKKVWKLVTVDACQKATRRVVLNMEESVKLKGGNMYSEGRAS